MVDTKVVKRILEYLKQQKSLVTPTQIHLANHTDYRAVVAALQYLDEDNKVEILKSSGGTSFVRILSTKK